MSIHPDRSMESSGDLLGGQTTLWVKPWKHLADHHWIKCAGSFVGSCKAVLMLQNKQTNKTHLSSIMELQAVEMELPENLLSRC